MEGNPTHTYPRRVVLGVCESLTVIEKRLDSILDELHDAPRDAKSRDHVIKAGLRAFGGSEAIIVSLTELGVSSETIGRLQKWKDDLFACFMTIVATDTARENPDFGAEFSQTFGPIPAPEDDKEEHERLQWIRCGHGIGPVYECQMFIAGLVEHLQMLPTTPDGEANSPNGEKPETATDANGSATGDGRKGTKHGRDAGNKLKADACRQLVLDYVKEHRDFGTLKNLREMLIKDKGLTRSTSTLSRYLKGTRYAGNPRRAARGRSEREAVANEGPTDLSDQDAWTMPDDVS